MAGACNTKISLPLPITTLNKCQTYRCPVSGVCNKVSKPDGTDCSTLGAPLHSACLNGVCSWVVTDVYRFWSPYNIPVAKVLRQLVNAFDTARV